MQLNFFSIAVSEEVQDYCLSFGAITGSRCLLLVSFPECTHVRVRVRVSFVCVLGTYPASFTVVL